MNVAFALDDPTMHVDRTWNNPAQNGSEMRTAETTAAAEIHAVMPSAEIRAARTAATNGERIAADGFLPVDSGPESAFLGTTSLDHQSPDIVNCCTP